jgi:hypothetical protein
MLQLGRTSPFRGEGGKVRNRRLGDEAAADVHSSFTFYRYEPLTAHRRYGDQFRPIIPRRIKGAVPLKLIGRPTVCEAPARPCRCILEKICYQE